MYRSGDIIFDQIKPDKLSHLHQHHQLHDDNIDDSKDRMH
jgi:hypothetical protein